MFMSTYLHCKTFVVTCVISHDVNCQITCCIWKKYIALFLYLEQETFQQWGCFPTIWPTFCIIVIRHLKTLLDIWNCFPYFVVIQWRVSRLCHATSYHCILCEQFSTQFSRYCRHAQLRLVSNFLWNFSLHGGIMNGTRQCCQWVSVLF